jgi:hypothetical protein
MDISSFLGQISRIILNPLIILLFAIAFLVFIFGIFQFINSEAVDDSRNEGKKKIVYGLIGMFIMFSAFGIVRFILNTFGLQGQTPKYLEDKIGKP